MSTRTRSEDTAKTPGRRRGGGRASRREARLLPPIIHRPTLRREIPVYELLDAEGVELIHETAMTIVEEIGVDFLDDDAIKLWKAAGAQVKGHKVFIPRELLMELIGKAPSEFTLHARDPEKSVQIGERNMIFAPQGGAFIHDLDGVRRRVVKDDLPTIVKLLHCLSPIHLSSAGWAIDLDDVPVPVRHLEQIYCPVRYSDKPYCASSYSKEVANDAIEMSRIVFGQDFVANNTVTATLANCNSPLKWDGAMLEGARIFAEAGQAVIFSPFVIYGASTPPHQLGAMAQVVAESLTGVAYSQLVRPGTPALFANAPMGVSMKSGSPTQSVPEAEHLFYLTGQMARRYNLPWRNQGPKSGSKVLDYWSGVDAAIRAQAAVKCGANWISHCTGAMEGSILWNLSKMVLDAELMDSCYTFASGLSKADIGVVLQMLRERGDESHFLGADYTRENMPYMPELQDNEVYDTWVAEGSKDSNTRGLESARSLLARYDEIDPGLDPAIDEALQAYMRRCHEERL
ncbi:trimethylamine methyltransferase family protein [Ruegeria sp.]|uniref:trimethylamine methyltransferase family protein n=1 Tax=Ruegeria sp. TaxID=1879320 RepID=UPI002311637A|nr:trimethylamine methyltransferase family protein [Ruegeria sp.]MDA7965554.1 trimethylamine methyltransferase family protein [Ruegeria sp.]